MALYTLSEMVQVILEDIGIADLPIIETVGMDKIVQRLENSALKEFSVRYPYIKHFEMNDECLLHKNQDDAFYSTTKGIDYVIPREEYEGHQLLGIANIVTNAVSGYNDSYIPYTYSFSPDAMINMLSDIQMTADLGRMMAKSMTWEFTKPNKIRLYNGWLSGKYDVIMMLTHDTSLSTIPDTALTHFRKLATYDVEWFLYNRFKRLQNLDVGIGNFELKIDDWTDAQDKFRQYLDDIDEEGNLDIDYITYF